MSNSGTLTIGEALDGHRNSFGAIRLGLALAVIVSHGFILGGWGTDPTYKWSGQQSHIGTLAVLGFLAISGYVVTKSAASTDVLQFAWRRVLRLFPAYWLVLLATALTVGPAIWMIEGRELAGYFALAEDGPFSYVASNWFLIINQWNISDIFESTNPFGSVNGSLWTLEYEAICYLLIGAVAVVGALRNARVLLPIMTGFFALLQVANVVIPGASGSVMPLLGNVKLIELMVVFLYGATFAVYSKQIPFSNILGVASVAILFVTLWKGGFTAFGMPALVYAIIWVAVALPKWFHRIGSKNDYSYGVYLYGWPVQQVGAYFGWFKLGYVPYVLISIALALACAWASWNLIEKRAHGLKDWGPGKGMAYWGARARILAPFLLGRRERSQHEVGAIRRP